MESSDFATMGMPRPQENRFAALVASVHQNSTWWNRLIINRSDWGLVRTKCLNPTSLKPGLGQANGAFCCCAWLTIALGWSSIVGVV